MLKRELVFGGIVGVAFFILILTRVSNYTPEYKNYTNLSGNVVMVIAHNGFCYTEMIEPMEVMKSANLSVVVASSSITPAISMEGLYYTPDMTLDEINVSNFDAIVFVGGSGVNANDPKALSIAKEFYENEKIVAAICAAPYILANAGILNGKKACISSGGAIYVSQPVVVDGRVITADGPSTAKAFGETIVSVLAQRE